MNRNVSVVAVVLLLSTSSGCCGMKNFLFGRGAQCGLCNKLGAPAPALPYAPPLAAADCDCGQHLVGEVCPNDGTCDSYGAAYGPDAAYSNSYGPIVSDPYGEQIIGGGVIHDQGVIYGSGAMGPGTIVNEGIVPGSMSDNFDSRGDRIIQADPLPPNAKLAPQVQ